jgi:hypothetical protein
MKRLEREILVRLSEISKGEPLETAVSIHQFHGIDIQPFAVELAKVTLMLAKEQEVRETAKLHDSDGLLVLEQPLPLDNLDHNIVCADALFTEWPKADAIIGNPPYLGSRYIAQELGYNYAKRVQDRFPGVPKMADFCTHWFRLAHDALPENGRAGLVATKTIRQNEGREASLDYVVKNGGTITEAVSTQVWSGDAQVHVSIVNWIKGDQAGEKTLTTQIGDRVSDAWKIENLPIIPSSLSSSLDVSTAIPLLANQKPKRVFQGQNPVSRGFFLSDAEAKNLIEADPQSAEVIFPYMIGDDLVTRSKPGKYVIDFAQRDQFDARVFRLAFEHVQKHVMSKVAAKANAEKVSTGKNSTRWSRLAERWWHFRDYQPGTMRAIGSIPRYVACARVTKRPIFEFISSGIHPDTMLTVFPMADDYSFGIIQSMIHFEWFKARCSTLGGTFRYTSDTVFDSFPWPQSPTRPQLEAVAREAVALRQLRREVMAKMNWSLRDLYRTLDEPGSNPLRDAQARLDTAVRAAYAMPKDADILAFLLALNQTCAAKEAVGEPITPPGLPLPIEEQAGFVTGDCIHV